LEDRLEGAERRFVEGAIRREKLFLALSVAGVAVAFGLAAYYGYRRVLAPGFPLWLRSVLVLLILLNARSNLRQYRYARVLRRLSGADR